MAVITNNIASIYSIIFFVLLLLMNNLRLFPKIAQIQIEGKQTTAAVIVRKKSGNIEIFFSRKKADTTVKAIVQAFGLMN